MKKLFTVIFLISTFICFGQLAENEVRLTKIFEKIKLDESPTPNYKINEVAVYFGYEKFSIISPSYPRIYVLDNYGKDKVTDGDITFSLIKATKFEITPAEFKLGRRTYRLRILLDGGGEANYEVVEFIEKTDGR